VAEPDALLLAAYAEGRLSEAEAEPVEAWLATAPDALGDVVAARMTYQRPPWTVFEHVLDKATALVPGETTPAGAAILPFRPRLRPPHLRPPHLRPQWRAAIAWSSLAASILCASLVGFSMGSDAYTNLAGTQSVDSATADGLTPSLDNYFSDDSGT
jgi:hypothetical protein